MSSDAHPSISGPERIDLTTQLRREAKSRSRDATERSVPGDPWGIDTELGALLAEAADELERLRRGVDHALRSYCAADEEYACGIRPILRDLMGGYVKP